MDTFVSGMQTSITSKSGLTGTTRGTDSSRLNKDREPLEFGKLFRRMAIVAVKCFMDTTVCRTTHMWIQVKKFQGYTVLYKAIHRLWFQNCKVLI